MSKPKATITPAIGIDADAENFQCWTARCKAAPVIDILQGKTTAAKAAREHALTHAEVEQRSRAK